MAANEIPSAKSGLRASLAAARAARATPDLDAARAAICARVLAHATAGRWSEVAAYEPMPTEPGSIAVLAGLVSLGMRVLVPVTRPDRDLYWAPWTLLGRGDPLGPEAIGAVDAILVPALAAATDGTRLGRGGGSYDRALPRARADAVLVAVLFDGELVPWLPRDVWDRPVHAAVMPSGWVDL
jgi:5-formyltetrahydrofolate cyclo-ligase